jgi:MoxR-like ATPase
MRTTFQRYPEIVSVAGGADILEMRKLVRQVPVASHVETLAMRLVRATQPGSPHATETTRAYLEGGSGPRGLLAILHAAKARSLTRGNAHVSSGDVLAVSTAALRHRVQRNLRAEAEGLTPDDILGGIKDEIRESGKP